MNVEEVKIKEITGYDEWYVQRFCSEEGLVICDENSRQLQFGGKKVVVKADNVLKIEEEPELVPVDD
uniref:Uncharacterized protein n=1 Tax=Marseillevirus LCMAC101 TaxID=2506602 RepID=A0A481YSH2_9VIRU|nr:MAG: hypothetical protein LCMAC101_05150 [Marseillevirus LCMAC101]